MPSLRLTCGGNQAKSRKLRPNSGAGVVGLFPGFGRRSRPGPKSPKRCGGFATRPVRAARAPQERARQLLPNSQQSSCRPPPIAAAILPRSRPDRLLHRRRPIRCLPATVAAAANRGDSSGAAVARWRRCKHAAAGDAWALPQQGAGMQDWLVPKVGLEPTRLAAGDFESPASTISPLGPAFRL